jgi:hypothetical protein
MPMNLCLYDAVSPCRVEEVVIHFIALKQRRLPRPTIIYIYMCVCVSAAAAPEYLVVSTTCNSYHALDTIFSPPLSKDTVYNTEAAAYTLKTGS